MKKIVSLLLAAILAFTMLVPAMAADQAADAKTDYPVIIVPGYSASQLVMTNDDGSEEDIWYIDINTVLEVVNEYKAQLVLGAGLLATGQPDYITNLIEPHVRRFIGPLACNPDGTSVYNVRAKLEPTAEATKWTGLSEGDRSLIGYLEADVDLDRLYVFGCDFRMDAIDNANRLGMLIDDVLATTGSDKVNLIAQSYGGQVTGTYLSLHAEDAGDKVYNVVMLVPALGGATLAYDFFADEMRLDSKNLAEYLEYGFMTETDFHLLLDSDPNLTLVENLIHAAMPLLRELVGYWLSLWDFIPYPYYKTFVEQLDPNESKELIEKTTYFHEEIMNKYHENLTKAQASGVHISIIAGSGNAAVSGMRENSDGIIPISGSTGATPAPYGKRFSDGYVCLGTTCSDPTHNHLSPAMQVDASTCYLPENTWIVDGYYHGLDRKDPFIFSLFLKQLLSVNPLSDVHADPSYPQFHTAAPISLVVHAKFDRSAEGYISAQDTGLVIRNYSASPVLITDISVYGADISFDVPYALIPSGGQRTVKFSGELPSVSRTVAAVTVSYLTLGTSSFTPVGQRTFDFTIMNGDASVYDADNPYTDASHSADILNVLDNGGRVVFEKLGLTETVNAFYKMIERFITIIRSLVAFFRAV